MLNAQKKYYERRENKRSWTLTRGEIVVAIGSIAMVPTIFGALLVTFIFGGVTATAGALVGIYFSGQIPFLGVPLGVFLVSLIIRIGATLRYILPGFRALPRNFRRLTLCTSPWQEPELVPGLRSDETEFTLPNLLSQFRAKLHSSEGTERVAARWFYLPAIVVWFVPGWLYRITLKSTAWFWWPLAFLGGDLS